MGKDYCHPLSISPYQVLRWVFFFPLSYFHLVLSSCAWKWAPCIQPSFSFFIFSFLFTASVQTILSPLWEPHDTFCINFTKWGWERQQKCSLPILTTDVFSCPSYLNMSFVSLTSPNARESVFVNTGVNGSPGQWSRELTESLLCKPDPSSLHFQAISSTLWFLLGKQVLRAGHED